MWLHLSTAEIPQFPRLRIMLNGKNGTDAAKRPAVVYGEEYFYDICFDSSERKQPYTLAVRFLYAKADAYESDNNFFSASVPVARARKALEAVGIKGVVD